MPDAKAEYAALVTAFAARDGVTAGQMFGKPCLKINGRAFVAQHLETAVFKPTGPAHSKALAVGT